MTQKPMLRAKVQAHALRASLERKKEVCREQKYQAPEPASVLVLLFEPLEERGVHCVEIKHQLPYST